MLIQVRYHINRSKSCTQQFMNYFSTNNYYWSHSISQKYHNNCCDALKQGGRFERERNVLFDFSLLWRRNHCRWRAAKLRPVLDTHGLWARRNLYRATPAVARALGSSGLIWRTAPFSCLLRHTHGGAKNLFHPETSVGEVRNVTTRPNLKIRVSWTDYTCTNIPVKQTLSQLLRFLHFLHFG
jgi:hypothetical protein